MLCFKMMLLEKKNPLPKKKHFKGQFKVKKKRTKLTHHTYTL